jgi:putative transposase
MTLQRVRDDDPRSILAPFEELAEELLRRLLVPPALHQDSEDLAILIDRPPEIMPFIPNGEKPLIQMPLVVRPRPAVAQLMGIGLTKLSGLYQLVERLVSRSPGVAYSAHEHTSRFPAEIISHGVWLYYRFCLSYRDVEELLFARGIIVSYEAIRQWCRRFGQTYANQLRRRRPQPGDKWHLDEVFLTINGERHYLWRAVDQDGHILDILVQHRRDKQAAKKFFRKLLKGLKYVPRVLTTDKLKSYGAARRELLPSVEHRQHRYLNNRAENSHQPTRQRERRLQGFKSPGYAQRFLVAYGPLAQHFRLRRHRLSASADCQEMSH